MKSITKFSDLQTEKQKILESIKKNHGKTAIDIAKNLGYNSLEEVAKEKKLLTKLESLLKSLPNKEDVSEDEAKEIEAKEKKKSKEKSLETEEEEEAVSKGKDDNEVAESEEDKSADENEETTEKVNKKSSIKVSNDKNKRRIQTFEDFVKTTYKSNKDVSEETGKVNEFEINEKDITTEDDFKEYAKNLLQQAHGDDYDETKADETINGLISKYEDDFGAMIGALQSSMG